MLNIENIQSLTGKYIGHWKIHYVGIEMDTYLIKVVHNGSPFDSFNLCVKRQRTKHGDYRVLCIETNVQDYLPIECIRNKDAFLQFLIYNLI